MTVVGGRSEELGWHRTPPQWTFGRGLVTGLVNLLLLLYNAVFQLDYINAGSNTTAAHFRPISLLLCSSNIFKTRFSKPELVH
ncbi:hypothetical protein J6590_034039 [Homalodisca vitripennis]|nr:hypothetical protein J6590_034039 [Homalodisca vitripennis]